MKHKIPVIAALLIFINLVSQKVYSQPAVGWADNIVGQGYDETFDVVLDSSRNVFICGQVEFTSYFDGYPLSTAGIHDIYLAKYSPNGTLIWAKREGGVGGDKAISIDVDAAGNSYICGEYEEDFTFGNTNVEADAGNNFFVAKYDPAGNFKWVKTLQGGSETIRGFAIAVDSAGNVYGGGTFRDKARYDGSTLYTTRGSTDVILVKFTSTGHFVWGKRIGGSDSDEITGLDVKGDKLYVTGYFSGGCKFGSTTLNSYGDMDFYVAQYDTSGSYIWAKHGGSSDVDQGLDVTVNSSDDVICTGNFRGTANFSGTSLTSNGYVDAFIVSYDDSGNLLWAKNYGGGGADGGSGIVTDRNGDIYFTGDFAGVGHFDTIDVVSHGDVDIFAAKCDAAGNAVWVKGMGGPDGERGRSCAVDRFGNVFVNGEYWSYITLDTFQLTGQLLIDAFLTRIGSYPICHANAQVTNEIVCYNNCTGAAQAIPTGESPFTYLWTTAANQTSDSVFNLCPGSYTVTITDGFGCVATETVSLNQPQQLTLSNVIVSDESCINCHDGSIDITVSGGTNPYQYSWADGSTSEDRTNLATGTYYICITDSNSCGFCDTIFVGNTMIGIEDIDASSDFKVYNDIQNAFIRIETKKFSDAAYEIYSVNGQVVLSGKLEGFITTIDLNNFSKGTYFIAVNEGQKRMGKIFLR